MQLGVLATDNGKHSDEKLAIAVAMDIVNIGANASGQQAIDGRKLENKIVEIMEAQFARLAAFEHAEIDAKGTAHLSSPQNVHPEILEDAVTQILAAIDTSPFATWFTTEQARTYVRASAGKYLGAAHHMHRDHFAKWGEVGHHTDLKKHDKHNKDCPHVQGWIAAQLGLPVPQSDSTAS